MYTHNCFLLHSKLEKQKNYKQRKAPLLSIYALVTAAMYYPDLVFEVTEEGELHFGVATCLCVFKTATFMF